jgi:hypothetical protein
MKKVLIGLALVLVSFALFILPAFAWTDCDQYTARSSIWPDQFWTTSIACGNSNGNYFTDWYQAAPHGAGSVGWPPTFFCAYSHTYYHFPLDHPVVVQTRSEGVVTDKFGEFVEDFDATATIYAT